MRFVAAAPLLALRVIIVVRRPVPLHDDARDDAGEHREVELDVNDRTRREAR